MQMIIDGFNAFIAALAWQYMFTFIILAWLFHGVVQRLAMPTVVVLKQIVQMAKWFTTGWLVAIFGIVLGYFWVRFGQPGDFKDVISALAMGMTLHKLVLQYVLEWLSDLVLRQIDKNKRA